MEKTKGQRLYEYLHPKHIKVVRYDDVFRTAPFEVPNPNHVVDWKFLTQKCRDNYERLASGHHIFSGESVG